jgi:ribosomal protein S18 acetylase RimI-like enzyme
LTINGDLTASSGLWQVSKGDLMKVVERDLVESDLGERLWSMYVEAFEPLSAAAVQRHLMVRWEFDEMLADARVTKILVFDDEASLSTDPVAGMATVTNDLCAVPLISPDYFRARWPRLFTEKRIWYVSFLAVAPDYHGTRVASLLVEPICERAGAEGGLVGVDICAQNEALMRLPTLLLRLARTYVPSTALLRLDAQTYWAFDFPAAESA